MSKEEIGIFKQIDKEEIKRQIYEIRGKKVMFDKDIADYFEVTTGNLNKAMKRNIKRFPDSFCFQLSKEEYSRFQNGSLDSVKILSILHMYIRSKGLRCLHRHFIPTEQLMQAYK